MGQRQAGTEVKPINPNSRGIQCVHCKHFHFSMSTHCSTGLGPWCYTVTSPLQGRLGGSEGAPLIPLTLRLHGGAPRLGHELAGLADIQDTWEISSAGAFLPWGLPVSPPPAPSCEAQTLPARPGALVSGSDGHGRGRHPGSLEWSRPPSIIVQC